MVPWCHLVCTSSLSYLDLVTFAIFSYQYILDAIVSHSFCAVVVLIYCWPLAHGSTWCHLLYFVFDNLSIKLNLLFGCPCMHCLLHSPLFIQIRSMHLSGTLSRLPGLVILFVILDFVSCRN